MISGSEGVARLGSAGGDIGNLNGPGKAQDALRQSGETGLAADVEGAFDRMVNGLKKAESVAIGGVVGAASTQEVVEAVMEAERTLQTAIAIRNKVVEAYLEMSRMQI